MYETVEQSTEKNIFSDKEINMVMQQSFAAFSLYKKQPQQARAKFLETIADEIESLLWFQEIESLRTTLVPVAMQESNLPEARLNGEIGRTTGQLKLFANLLKEGSWVEAAIDTADATRTPPRPDIRKMLVPMGPVVVFGASNFPFAFSTAGGDTASALAAGCTVVIKGHPAHPQTSLLVFGAIEKAIAKCGLPAATVQHVTGQGNAVGKLLVQHPLTTAVGFTGSFSGGTALLCYAQEREAPIPVFAEMSSINPVVFYPDILEKNAVALASQYAASITLGVGQFCTNPGLLLSLQSNAFENFLAALGTEIKKVQPQKMLHNGICAAYQKSIYQLQEQQGLVIIAQAETATKEGEAGTLLAKVSGTDFLANKHLAEEIFGPYSLAVVCQNKEELVQVLQSLKGQLTSTIMATENDIAAFADVIEIQQAVAGRVSLNNVPTGVEVCASMVHGGPFPATTDARFTSVGSSAIKRWVQPVCLQNFSDAMLPDELKNENPLGIMRLVNNVHTREAV